MQANSDEVWTQNHKYEVGFVRPIFNQEILSSHPQIHISGLNWKHFYEVLGVLHEKDLRDDILVENLQVLKDCWQKHCCVYLSQYCMCLEKFEKKLRPCAGCQSRRYCSKVCQSTDWQDGHEHQCLELTKTRTRMQSTDSKATPLDIVHPVCEICETVHNIVDNLYKLMTQKAAALLHESWIWACGNFVPPQHVVQDDKVQSLFPYLFTLQKSWQKLPVFAEIPEDASPEALLGVLSEAQKDQARWRDGQEGHPLKLSEIATRALKFLANADLQNVNNLIVPTSDAALVSVLKVYYPDMKWIPPTDMLRSERCSISTNVPKALWHNKSLF